MMKNDDLKATKNNELNLLLVIMKVLGLLIILLGAIGMIGNTFYDSTPFGIVFIGFSIYLCGKEINYILKK